jgi:hypothetical protein
MLAGNLIENIFVMKKIFDMKGKKTVHAIFNICPEAFQKFRTIYGG